MVVEGAHAVSTPGAMSSSSHGAGPLLLFTMLSPGYRAGLKPLNYVFSSYATTVFEVMSKLANQHAAVNLGQGFPDSEGPEAMKQIATKALYEHSNQYPSLLGVPELRQAVARHSSQQQQIPCDWASETLITVGATEGLAAAFMGLCNPGDEVIVFEPLYDSYAGMARQVGWSGVTTGVSSASIYAIMPMDALLCHYS